MLWPTEPAFKATVNLTSTALNANPTWPCVFNVKLQSTESSSSQSTSVFALTVSTKTRTEHASHAQKAAQSVHLQQNVTLVLLKPPTTVTELVDALLEPSSEFQQTTSDIANNVSNTATSVETH